MQTNEQERGKMNENFKKMMAEAMKDLAKPDIDSQMKEMAEMSYKAYKSFTDAGFNEMQAMSILLEIIGSAK